LDDAWCHPTDYDDDIWCHKASVSKGYGGSSNFLVNDTVKQCALREDKDFFLEFNYLSKIDEILVDLAKYKINNTNALSLSKYCLLHFSRQTAEAKHDGLMSVSKSK